MSAEMAMPGTMAAFGLPCAIEVLQRFAFDLTKVKAEHRPDDGLYVHSVELWLNACRLTSCFATYFRRLVCCCCCKNVGQSTALYSIGFSRQLSAFEIASTRL